MSSRFDHLPVEVTTNIFSCLRHADLAILMRVSKSTRQLAAPLLWTHIELHRPEWHEFFQYDDTFNLSEVNRSHQLRRYVEYPSDGSSCWRQDDYCPPTDVFRYYMIRAERFVRFLRPFENLVCPPQLDAHTPYHCMRSLCLDVGLGQCDFDGEFIRTSFWTMFSAFPNLESLELIVDWPYTPQDWDTREQQFSEYESCLPPLTKLRKLCLRGYIPARFACWAMTHPEKLETLELSILDRPISSSLCHDPKNPPPTRKKDQHPLEDLEEDGEEIPWVTEASDSDSESEEDLSDEAVGPRALAVCQGTDIPERMVSLSTLILTRPSQSSLGEGENAYSFQDSICWSIRSDKAILREWTRMIRASRRTLRHLILDQRPFCGEIELDSTGDTEFLEIYAYGSGFRRFKEMVIPVLLEDAEWPVLESIRFYGFDVSEVPETKPHPRVSRPSLQQSKVEQHTFLPQVKERFEPLAVDVKSCLGRRMVFDVYEGTVSHGDGLGGQPDVEEEEED